MKIGKLLIVDDEKNIRDLMQEIFEEEGYQVETAANGVQARQAWQTQMPDVIFLDIWMPDVDGITLLKEMQEADLLEHTKVIMMSGHGTIETAIEATKLGAYDFLEKPISLAKLIVSAERAIEHGRLHQENRQLKQKQPDYILPIGKSRVIKQLRETIERLSKFSMPILITGESGTGKHFTAKALHKTSTRKSLGMIEVNALDLNDYASSTEPQAIINLIRSADHSTLVIANIEQLNNDGQRIIMDLIQHQRFQARLDQPESKRDIRIIALSRDGLEEAVEAKQFRDDLYQRLMVMPIQLPALRQHTEDIPDLIDFFVDIFVTRDGLEYRDFSVSAQNIMRQYSWPGNLKELQNIIQRLLILGTGEVDDDEVKAAFSKAENTADPMAQIDTTIALKEAKDRLEAAYLSQLLRETGGNVSETAKRSGIDRTNLYRKLKSLGIDPKNPI